ncbi:MAG: sulfite exporter TauE/SafE family protein, partial [Nanoarchaeota archaeon]|nr:sulfite exporter TauE/SafE family protein [Nanoarchaeota archaeon]
MVLTKKTIKTAGMTCHSCEKIIAKQVLKLKGVKGIDVDYATEKTEIEYDPAVVSLGEIKKAIEDKGYLCKDFDGNKKNSWLGWAFAGIGFILVIYFAWTIYGKIQLPAISAGMSYGLLFVVGLLTGFHCVGMCGGFVVSYTAKGAEEGKKPARLHLSYGIGKLISYTVIGAAFGLLGSIIAFTPAMRGGAGIIAGLFLVIFGLKMLNVIPALRKFQIRMPKFVSKFVGKESKTHSNNPLVIGLLNGLMIACGPLQAIYIMAAGTGSWLEGA